MKRAIFLFSMIGKQDLELLIALRRSARDSLTDISTAISMPVSTVHTKLRQFQRYIPRYTALVHFPAFGYAIPCILWLKCSKDKRASMLEYLRRHPLINNAWEIAEGYDVIAEAVGRSLCDLEDLKDSLRNHGAVQLHLSYVIRDIARENLFFSEGSAAELRALDLSLLRKNSGLPSP